jgi:hypothetical protein
MKGEPSSAVLKLWVVSGAGGLMPKVPRVSRGIRMLARGDQTAWLGWQDSNSETSPQNIPFKGRTDFRESSRILTPETIRV